MDICIKPVVFNWSFIGFYVANLFLLIGANEPPKFIHDMNKVQISEQTPPGTEVYRLLAEDLESEVYYSIIDTDAFNVDTRTGIVKLSRFLNKNLEPEIKFTVICEDLAVDGSRKNTVSRRVTVYVVDHVNANAPLFESTSAIEINLNKDAPIGTVLGTYSASDIDAVGQPLTFGCNKAQGRSTDLDICKYFTLVYKNETIFFVKADLVLFKSLSNIVEDKLNFILSVTDGTYSTNLTIKLILNEKLHQPSSTIELPAFVTELETTQRIFEIFDTIKPIVNDFPTTVFSRMTTTADTDDLSAEHINDTETSANESETSTYSSKSITTPDVTRSTTLKENFEIQFIPSKSTIEIVENWPASFPLPFKPRLSIKYDSSNPIRLFVKLLHPQLEINSSSFSVEPSILYGDRNFDIILENSTVIDRKLYDRIELIVSAIDESGDARGELMVSVNLIDVNNNKPKFSQIEYNMSLEDDSAEGKLIGRVWATDPDTDIFGTNGLAFHLIGQWAKYFRLQQNSRPGSVDIYAHPCDVKIITDCITYKQMPDQLIMVIRVTDTNGTGLYTDTPITINLLRMNVAKPKFDREIYFAKLHEKETLFDPILILQATDDDDAQGLMYGLDDPTHLFGIDNETGMIFVSKSEHVTIKNLGVRFNLTGTVTDGEHEPVKTKITIEIIPSPSTSSDNQAPTFMSSNYFATVPPNAQKGYVIINVIAKDPEHQPLQYYLTSGGSENFSVRRETGEILFNGNKFKTDQTFTINVIAVDGGSPQGYSKTTVSIICLGLGSISPQFDKNVFVSSLFENATVGSLIEIPQIIDEDAVDGFSVKIISINGYDEEGQWVSNENLRDFLEYKDDALITKRTLYDKGIYSIHVELMASDLAHPLEDPAHAFGVINVIQTIKTETELFDFLGLLVNQTVTVNISSDTPVNAFVYHFRIVDKNSNSFVVFGLKNESEYFSLNDKTGLVTLKKPLLSKSRYNSTDSYHLEIEAKNVRTKTIINANLVVNVIQKPSFLKLQLNQESYTSSVVENVPIGSFVFRFSTLSSYCSAYNFALTGVNANSFFVDDQGRILTSSKIDREQHQVYSFNIEVSCRTPLTNFSSAVIPATAPVIINVLDLNDNPPIFDRQSYSATIQETSNVDSYVLTVSANDPDLGINGTILYSLSALPDVLQDRLIIDNVDGQIKTSKILLGLYGNYKFFVNAVDGGNLNSSVYVNLLIQSSNKCRPKFLSSNVKDSTIISVRENQNAGIILTTIKATTEDPKCTLKYTFRDQSTDQNIGYTNEFQIDSDTGELRTKRILDREQQNSYKLIISVSDSNKNDTIPAQLVVQVIVLDENDNLPTFQPPSAFIGDNCSTETNALSCWFDQETHSYNFTVYENEPSGTVLGKITATDPDEGENGTVYYHLLTSADSPLLLLDSKSGFLKTKFAYDREKQEFVEVSVLATNNKSEPTSIEQKQIVSGQNFAKIYIHILDRNDHGPSFDKALYLGAISYDTAPETLVSRIRAVDPDISGGGVYYRLKKSEYHYKKSVVEERNQFYVDRFSGEIRTKMNLKEFSQGYFQLVIDSFNDENQTTTNMTDSTTVKIWIFEADQLVRIVVNDSPLNITDRAESIAKSFGDSLGSNVVLQQIEYNKDIGGSFTTDKVDLLAVFIDRTTEEIMSSDRVLDLVDKTGLQKLSPNLLELQVVQILPAKSSKIVQFGSLSGAAIALIVFGCILFLGLLAFMLLLCYLKYSFIEELKVFRTHEPPPVKVTPSMLLSSKENPLWNNEIEKKPYEEQEVSLPMSNDERSAVRRNVVESVNPNVLTINSVPEIDVNSTYAKIHKPLSSRYSQNSSITEYDGTNLYQSLRK